MSHSKDGADAQLPPKLSPPLLPKGVYRRKRLYRQIKEVFAAGAALWVQGPAGAGKTTLTASFLDAERRQALWYQLDSNDGDIPSFFRHLCALLATMVDVPQLPILDPRLGQDPVRFADEFFRAYFDQMPEGAVLVLDDFQDVDGGGELDAVIGAAVRQLPPTRHLIVASREAPPKSLARVLMEGRLRCLDWEDLRLDDDEARQIASLRVPRRLRTAVPAGDLNRRAQGWVAGFVLMVQQAATGGALAESAVGPTPETVNEYFATELFERRPGRELEVLLTLSLLPRFTPAMAEALTGDADVPQLIDTLYRRNFFLTRHESEQGGISFRFHPLFREFLHHEVERHLSAEAVRELRVRAGDVLAEAGYTESAIVQYQAAQDWKRAEARVLAEAPRRYQAGELRTLQNWLSALPAERIDANPWLLLWRGASVGARSIVEGRGDLERAYRLFREAGDIDGALLAWCMVVEGYVFEWGNLHPLDAWIEALDELEPALAWAPAAIVQRATFAMFGALSYRRPQRGKVEEWARRAEDVFMDTTDPVIRALMGSQLAMFYAFSRGDLGRAAVFVDEIKGQSGERSTNPMAEIVFLVHHAVIKLWNTGDVSSSLELVREGSALAERSGVHAMDFLLAAVGAWASTVGGNFRLAEEYLEHLGRSFDSKAVVKRCMFHDSYAILNLHRGNIDLAKSQSEMSLELAHRGGMPHAESMCLLTAARTCSRRGEWEQAEAYRRLAEEIAEPMGNRFEFNHLRWFEAAECLQRDGAEAAVAPLREALGAGRAGNFFANLWLERDTFSRLCHLALVHDIEADYVRRLIGGLGLPALDPQWADDGWPFRLRIEVLAGLRVRALGTDGYERVGLHGRAGQLLEALVWSGGQGVSQERLADVLWPDAEGDAARRSFDTTLHRLRRALGDERLLILEDGRLSLHPGLTWTDAGALQAASRQLVHLVYAGGAPVTIQALQRQVIHRAAAFGGHEPTAPGLQALYAGLRREVEHGLDAAGRYWQGRSAWELSIDAFEARLQVNAVAEAAYLELMRIYSMRGLPAEALAIYHRCKENVKQWLGTAPGPEIEQLYRTVQTVTDGS